MSTHPNSITIKDCDGIRDRKFWVIFSKSPSGNENQRVYLVKDNALKAFIASKDVAVKKLEWIKSLDSEKNINLKETEESFSVSWDGPLGVVSFYEHLRESGSYDSIAEITENKNRNAS